MARRGWGWVGLVGIATASTQCGREIPAPKDPASDAATRRPNAPTPTGTAHPSRAGDPAIPATPPRPRSAKVTVLYRGATPKPFLRAVTIDDVLATERGETNLLGVDRARQRAWLSHALRETSQGDAARFEIVEVPLSAASPEAPRPTMTWGAKGASAGALGSGRFAAFANPRHFGEDLAKYAGIVEAIGRPATAADRRWPFLDVGVSARHIVHLDDDGHLVRRDRSGANPLVLTPHVSVVDPVLGPNGARAAFVGCDDARRGCFGLYLSDVADAGASPAPVHVAGIQHPESPVFSADGESVFLVGVKEVLGHGARHVGGCAYRVDAAPPHAVTKLACDDARDDVGWILSPSAKVGVLASYEMGAAKVVYRWVALPSGQVVARTIEDHGDHRLGPAVLSDQGALAVPTLEGVILYAQDGQRVVAPAMARQLVPEWDGDATYGVVLGEPDVEEIVRIELL